MLPVALRVAVGVIDEVIVVVAVEIGVRLNVETEELDNVFALVLVVDSVLAGVCDG